MQLSLFANAIDFIEKGIEEFIAAQGEEGKKRELKYAILHIAQGSELVLKQILNEKNPLFLLADIDSDKSDPQTVNVEKALKRISRLFTGTHLSKKQLDILERIRSKRNDLTYYEVNLNEHHAISMIAQTFPVLDFLLKNFLDKTLSEEVSKKVWEAFVNIEHVHKEYYNDLKSKYTFIEYGGHRLACGDCQMRTIAEVDGDLLCVYCDSTYGSEVEAIRKMKHTDIKEDIVHAFIEDKDLYACSCDDCFQDTAVYSSDEGCVVCLNCDAYPYFDFVFCPNCGEDSAVVEDHHDRDGILEEKATCMKCQEEVADEACTSCGTRQYHLHVTEYDDYEDSLDNGAPKRVAQQLCDHCYHQLQKIMRD